MQIEQFVNKGCSSNEPEYIAEMGSAATARPTPRSSAQVANVERYRDNWVRHLLGIARDLDRRVTLRLDSEQGYDQLRPSLGPFISLVWHAPRPLAQLARVLGISRQACSKLARLAEEAGYVERVDADHGARAQEVRLTRLGRRLVNDAVRMIFEAEASYAERIGEDRLRRFIAAAASLFSGLGLHEQTDPDLEEVARRSIGVLPLIARRVEDELRETTRARGHDVLQLSHARLIALIGHEGAGVSEMAQRQGVSRQATSATVRNLESLGYVRRETDEHDGRAVHVVLTRRGQTLIQDSLLALAELEQDFREILGARRFDDLVGVAADLHASLLIENDAVSTVASRVVQTPSDHVLREIASRLEERLGKTAAKRLGVLLASAGLPESPPRPSTRAMPEDRT